MSARKHRCLHTLSGLDACGACKAQPFLGIDEKLEEMKKEQPAVFCVGMDPSHQVPPSSDPL